MEYGNLAYKIEPDSREIQTKKTAAQKLPRQRLNIRVVFFAVLISFAAYFMISKQVAVFETSKQVDALRASLEAMQSKEVQKSFELEQEIDLAEVEEIATTKLNMQRPEQSQRVYVNVTGTDVTEITSKDTEGVKNTLSGAARAVKKNIIGIFGFNW